MKEKIQDALLYAALVAIGVFLGACVAPSVADYRMATQYAQAVADRQATIERANDVIRQKDAEIQTLKSAAPAVEPDDSE